MNNIVQNRIIHMNLTHNYLFNICRLFRCDIILSYCSNFSINLIIEIIKRYKNKIMLRNNLNNLSSKFLIFR